MFHPDSKRLNSTQAKGTEVGGVKGEVGLYSPASTSSAASSSSRPQLPSAPWEQPDSGHRVSWRKEETTSSTPTRHKHSCDQSVPDLLSRGKTSQNLGKALNLGDSLYFSPFVRIFFPIVQVLPRCQKNTLRANLYLKAPQKHGASYPLEQLSQREIDRLCILLYD